MEDEETLFTSPAKREPWNKGKFTGAKPAAGKKPGDFMFSGRRGSDRSMTTRQYARLVSEWIVHAFAPLD